MNFFACNWDLILHPLNFLPLSSVRLNLATVVEKLLISACLSCTELNAKALSTQWGSSKGCRVAAASLYKCFCLQFKNLNVQNYIPELNLDPQISLIIPCTCPGLECCQVSQQHTCARGVMWTPWVDIAMLYAFICLAVGVILMASGLFLSKAISKSERSCLKAFTSHELCILFCILPFHSLTCSFRSCNVLFSPPIKSDSLVPRAEAKESLFIIYFQHTTSLVGWLVDFFSGGVYERKCSLQTTISLGYSVPSLLRAIPICWAFSSNSCCPPATTETQV